MDIGHSEKNPNAGSHDASAFFSHYGFFIETRQRAVDDEKNAVTPFKTYTTKIIQDRLIHSHTVIALRLRATYTNPQKETYKRSHTQAKTPLLTLTNKRFSATLLESIKNSAWTYQRAIDNHVRRLNYARGLIDKKTRKRKTFSGFFY